MSKSATFCIITMILIALGVIALVGYGILFFLGATIGGVLTLFDKTKADSNDQ